MSLSNEFLYHFPHGVLIDEKFLESLVSYKQKHKLVLETILFPFIRETYFVSRMAQ
jgi:hypothetical protein